MKKPLQEISQATNAVFTPSIEMLEALHKLNPKLLEDFMESSRRQQEINHLEAVNRHKENLAPFESEAIKSKYGFWNNALKEIMALFSLAMVLGLIVFLITIGQYSAAAIAALFVGLTPIIKSLLASKKSK